MKLFAAILTAVIGLSAQASAQTFTDRLQTRKAGQGKITITHDKAIDELVNRNSSTATIAKKETGKAAAPAEAEKQPARPQQPAAESATAATTAEEPDTRKKVMGNSRKISGYRVQVFAGGNTRKDRQEAEKTGNEIKQNFPNTPVYVHFYSPRWICRVGNYRTYEEAYQMLQTLKKMGYGQALIVKGKITVQY